MMLKRKRKLTLLCAAPSAACRLPMAPQPCTGEPPNWVFDSSLGLCVPYKKDFCQTNANKFYSNAECHEFCGVGKDDGESDRLFFYVQMYPEDCRQTYRVPAHMRYKCLTDAELIEDWGQGSNGKPKSAPHLVQSRFPWFSWSTHQ